MPRLEGDMLYLFKDERLDVKVGHEFGDEIVLSGPQTLRAEEVLNFTKLQPVSGKTVHYYIEDCTVDDLLNKVYLI